jgi:hypothetical protein
MVTGSTHQANFLHAAAMLVKLVTPSRCLCLLVTQKPLLGFESIEHRGGRFCETILIIRT